MIFNNTLRVTAANQVHCCRPTNMESLLKIDSLPIKRAEILGEGVFTLIKDFSKDNGLDTDVFDRQPSQTDFLEVCS